MKYYPKHNELFFESDLETHCPEDEMPPSRKAVYDTAVVQHGNKLIKTRMQLVGDRQYIVCAEFGDGSQSVADLLSSVIDLTMDSKNLSA